MSLCSDISSTFSASVKALSPQAINRLSSVLSLSAVTGEGDGWAVPLRLVSNANAQAAHESVSQNVQQRGHKRLSECTAGLPGVTRGERSPSNNCELPVTVLINDLRRKRETEEDRTI